MFPKTSSYNVTNGLLFTDHAPQTVEVEMALPPSLRNTLECSEFDSYWDGRATVVQMVVCSLPDVGSRLMGVLKLLGALPGEECVCICIPAKELGF